MQFGLIDVSDAMAMRPDGHPGKYGHLYYNNVKVTDCAHWCLPGPVDTWNQFLLYMMKGISTSIYLQKLKYSQASKKMHQKAIITSIVNYCVYLLLMYVVLPRAHHALTCICLLSLIIISGPRGGILREKIHISIAGSERVRRWSFLAASPHSEYSYIGSMDKSWITKPRNSIEYERGVRRFIDFAFENSLAEATVCPCLKCGFRKKVTKGEMYDHLICTQFPKEYTLWFYHGEIEVGDPSSNVSNSDASNAFDDFNQDSIHDMLGDAFGTDMHWTNEVSIESDEDIDGVERVMPDVADAAEFEELASHAELPLYEGCTRYSRLSFLVKMYHIKCICGMTDKAMSMIFELLHDAFEHAEIPSSFYEAKKTILKLGMNYEKIHACPNNCMLYWGEDKEKEMCKVCNRSRWKLDTKGGEIQESNHGNIRKKVPAKVLRYFPLKPRLQRLFWLF
ncbi:uncharacterized protein LOC107632420 [Arachis ipaensis]|uniref:uncharacterized protein LOC107632420 n=1 Tax=Arachis ipaensis TaxID=130454 RepID=UPI000A2B3815|nr:uncharacterized protein LOC107632420 [Arachis ipaensis]